MSELMVTTKTGNLMKELTVQSAAAIEVPSLPLGSVGAADDGSDYPWGAGSTPSVQTLGS